MEQRWPAERVKNPVLLHMAYDTKQCSMLIITIDSLCVMLVKLDFGANMILLYLMSLGFFFFL